MSDKGEVARDSVSLTEDGVTYLWFVDDLSELDRQLVLDHFVRVLRGVSS